MIVQVKVKGEWAKPRKEQELAWIEYSKDPMEGNTYNNYTFYHEPNPPGPMKYFIRNKKTKTIREIRAFTPYGSL